MFVAMPSPDCSNSLNVRNPRTIRSRMINNDQRSPKISRETLTGQPDRRLDVGFSGTSEANPNHLQNASDKPSPPFTATADLRDLALIELRPHPLFLLADFRGQRRTEIFGFENLANFDFRTAIEGRTLQPFDGLLLGIDLP